MYLFSRSVRPGPGNPEKQMDWALRITENVNKISEAPVSLWISVCSPNAGQFVAGAPSSRIWSRSRRRSKS